MIQLSRSNRAKKGNRGIAGNSIDSGDALLFPARHVFMTKPLLPMPLTRQARQTPGFTHAEFVGLKMTCSFDLRSRVRAREEAAMHLSATDPTMFICIQINNPA
jgi:hypothetical protein